MLENMTDKCLNLIYSNNNPPIIVRTEDSFPKIKKLLRYYQDDVSSYPRFKFDGDAVYFYSFDKSISGIPQERNKRDAAERGDVMVSIWTPLKWYMGVSGIANKNNEGIETILEKINNNEFNKDIMELFERLSELYLSRGNLLLLPNSYKNGKRRLNPDKYSKTEDKLDCFLDACFDEKGLFEYFVNYENLVKWIKAEKLECMFCEDLDCEDNCDVLIKREKIRSLKNNGLFVQYRYKDFDEEDWKNYLGNVIKVIENRNRRVIQSRLPFYW